ncbi:Smr domain-containing protein [Giardia muris]|uniref:Smr domain-containing protein n=1 Tax=Giardia muris TaxID=5742 RepID=A0A4Z1T1T0_GIAMU|nr:Smr domain-containing protein [Giardia muris]|eukprot:TNJ29658.1 Smr domain-containing protein [Giardia muris]
MCTIRELCLRHDVELIDETVPHVEDLLRSPRTTDEIQDELCCLLGFDALDLITELLSNREELVKASIETELRDIMQIDEFGDLTEREIKANLAGDRMILEAPPPEALESQSQYESMSRDDWHCYYLKMSLGLADIEAVSLLRRCDWDIEKAIDTYYNENEERWISVSSSTESMNLDVDEQVSDDLVEYVPPIIRGRTVSMPDDKRVYALNRPPRYRVLGTKATDLHYFKVHDAENKVRNDINALVEKMQGRPDRHLCAYKYHIITGRGLHSSGPPALRNMVMDLLRSHKIHHRLMTELKGGAIEATITGDLHQL